MNLDDAAFLAMVLLSAFFAASGAITLLLNRIILGFKLLFSSFIPLVLEYLYLRLKEKRPVKIQHIEGEEGHA